METEILPQLHEVRQRIERGWCQRRLSNLGYGSACDPNATEWCIGGAIMAAIGTEILDTRHSRLVRALGFDRWDDMVRWNNADERTQQDILDRVDEAIGGIK